jgi:hypothetical protein
MCLCLGHTELMLLQMYEQQVTQRVLFQLLPVELQMRG